ncbi:hypothetical protein H1C71_021413 [Ictidomys tridecemlineatus]|nr:hypothetical protein H1C71_021413 [Ictidomys tridecemlineatus]KAG3268415.1 hypothetical protein H1C71_021413 [Ictidomys tridecemlineatus]KAG3268416.1 hypothetical protein H1C71_021413 [Ictidomys tridecemlineatus]
MSRHHLEGRWPSLTHTGNQGEPGYLWKDASPVHQGARSLGRCSDKLTEPAGDDAVPSSAASPKTPQCPQGRPEGTVARLRIPHPAGLHRHHHHEEEALQRGGLAG